MEEEQVPNHKRQFNCYKFMNATQTFPSFDVQLSDLNQYVLQLVERHKAGKIRSWDDLDVDVNAYFTPQRMEQMESVAPGWRKMSSYVDGVTLTHMICVFLGMFTLPEFQSISPEQQQLTKWIVLFHDVEKEINKGERDPKHGFRSAVITAGQLPRLGFAVTTEYESLIAPWSDYTYSAVKVSADYPEPVQDNEKLPEILTGIEKLFGEHTPAGLIVKGVLLHMSISVLSDWPQAAPLTEAEIKRYINGALMPLLRIMMLADNEGWVMFYPDDRSKQRGETLEAFEKVQRIIS
jgi:hypothetical protein